MRKLYVAGFAVLLCLSQTLKAQQAAKLVIPIGHTAAINAIDVSPDGRFYLTGSLDNTAKIWDNMVLIHANLFKGNNPIGEPFELKGTRDTKALVDLIVKEIKPRIAKGN